MFVLQFKLRGHVASSERAMLELLHLQETAAVLLHIDIYSYVTLRFVSTYFCIEETMSSALSSGLLLVVHEAIRMCHTLIV